MAGRQDLLASQIAGDLGHERISNLGEKKEDDEGILFYILFASGMYRSRRNLARKNAAAMVCSCETTVATICFVGSTTAPQ